MVDRTSAYVTAISTGPGEGQQRGTRVSYRAQRRSPLSRGVGFGARVGNSTESLDSVGAAVGALRGAGLLRAAACRFPF